MTVTLTDPEFQNLCDQEKAGKVRIFTFGWKHGMGWEVNYDSTQLEQGELLPLTPNTANK